MHITVHRSETGIYSIDNSRIGCSQMHRLSLGSENKINPYLTNGFSHYYHLGESTFIFRGIRSDF